jgi:hypothetical protein
MTSRIVTFLFVFQIICFSETYQLCRINSGLDFAVNLV